MHPSRLRSAATHYPYLRGLLTVPAGLLFVVAALGNWSWGPFRHASVFIACVLVIGVVCLWIDRWYNEHFGRVTPTRRQQLRVAAAVAIGVVVMIGGSLLLNSDASWSLDVPVNAVAATFGLLMLVYYAMVVGLHPHHVAIWGGLLVAGMLPVWNGADPSNIGLVMAGVCVMVNGALDHRLLVRSLGPAGPPVDAPA